MADESAPSAQSEIRLFLGGFPVETVVDRSIRQLLTLHLRLSIRQNSETTSEQLCVTGLRISPAASAVENCSSHRKA
jgi:hypothetical protein